METEISKQDAIKYLERKSFPGWDACSDKPTVFLSDVEYLIDLIYSHDWTNRKMNVCGSLQERFRTVKNKITF